MEIKYKHQIEASKGVLRQRRKDPFALTPVFVSNCNAINKEINKDFTLTKLRQLCIV